jgi:hypothetical protein
MAPFKAERLLSIVLIVLVLVVIGSSQAAPSTLAQPIDQGIIDVDIYIQHPNVPVNTQTGEVSVSGTVSCSQPSGLTGQLSLNIQVTQPVGQLGAVQGYRFTSGTCPGVAIPFVFTVTGNNGRFVGGIAYINASANNCAFLPPPTEATLVPPPTVTLLPPPTAPPTATLLNLAVQPEQVGGCDSDEANETVTLQPSLTTLAERSLQN